jgi:putative transposon-encoded protein
MPTGELVLTKKKLILSEDVEDIIRKEVAPIGNGAHVICPKKHVGKTVYLVVVKK